MFSFTFSLLLNNGLEGFYRANAAVANDIAAQRGGVNTQGHHPTTVMASSRAVNGYNVPDMEEMDTTSAATGGGTSGNTTQHHRSNTKTSAILPIANPHRQQQRRRAYPGTQNRPSHLQRLI